MAISSIFNTLTFGSINSGDYGIYITGEAVYNAPQRAVNMVTVPGRNGAVAIDQGRWENINVTYPAGTFGDDQSDFSEKVSAFRNAIMSLRGYQRLTDSYHPDEYRMGLFMEAFEVEPVGYSEAGQFSITFNCKPQRWLTSGETAVTVADGDTLTNPTLFASSPLIAVEGYGAIGFNGYEIEVDDGSYGTIELFPAGTKAASSGAISTEKYQQYTYDSTLFNTGDTLTVGASSGTLWFTRNRSFPYDEVSLEQAAYTVSQDTASTFTAGTPKSVTKSITASIHWYASSEGELVSGTSNYRVTVETRYTNTLNFYVLLTITYLGGGGDYFGFAEYSLNYGALTVDSSKSYLSGTTYIDCDLGECYSYDGTSLIDLNAYVDLGSDLPSLAPGNNSITADSTITSLEITPRWWRL